MEPGEQHEGIAGGGGEPVSDEELLRWAGAIAKARGRVQAARDIALNYRTLARALDDQTVSRVAREALLAAHRAESAQAAQAKGETDEELARRLGAAESQLGDTLDALERERERADALERRLELLEEQQAGEPSVERPARAPSTEPPAERPDTEPRGHEPSTKRDAVAEDSAASEAALVSRGAHRAGVVTLDPLEGERAALGEAALLVAEWRRLRGGEARRGSAVDRARAEERRWELELALIGDHGLALPPETEPLHPSRRDDQLRWRRVTLGRVRRERARAERLRLLRRVLTLGLWWR